MVWIGVAALTIRAFSRAASLSSDLAGTLEIVWPNLLTAVAASAVAGLLYRFVPPVVERTLPARLAGGRTAYLLSMGAISVILGVLLHIVTRTVFADTGQDEGATPLLSITFTSTFSFISILFVNGAVARIVLRLRRQERLLAEQLDEVERQRHALLASEERVRADIARSLHDDVQTRLLRAGMLLQALRDDVPSTAQPGIDEAIREIDQVREEGVRGLGRRLAPNLAALGLLAALRDLVHAYDGVLEVEFDFTDDAQRRFHTVRDDDLVALAVYRIAEQALQNAVKHGGARFAVVSLEVVDGTTRLIVEADGVAPPADRYPGEGTLIVESWLGEVGGAWALEPSLGEGSRFEAAIGPVAAGADGR